MPDSEIARLRRELEEQAQSAWRGLYGFAEVGKHQFITNKMERMGATWQALAKKVGLQEATRILIEIERDIDKEKTTPLMHAEADQQVRQGNQNGTACL
jgi:hypothetical protein